MPAKPLTVATTGHAAEAGTLEKSWFGAVQTGFHDFDGFAKSAEALELGLLRWPGGTLSETRPEVYGLDIPGLFDATDLWKTDPWRDRPDLASSMDYAIDTGMDFSMIVPTARYADDIELGETHLRGFLDDLFTGKYGALPPKMTLELGNEYHDLVPFEEDAERYGAVAARFAEVIQEASDLYLTEAEQAGIGVAVQMGLTEADNSAILGAFTPDALAATDTLVFHSLPISLRNLNRAADDGMTRFERFDTFADDWRHAIAAAGGDADPELFMSAWTVGSSTHDAGKLDLEWHEFGLRQGLVALDTVAGYSSMGVDSAAIWGIDVTNLNSVTTTEDGALTLSHTGEMFRMMSDSLVGKKLVGDFVPASRDDAIVSHSFTDGTELTSYVAINALGPENDEVLLDFAGASNVRLVHAEMLSTELDPAFTGDFDDLDARLHEVPVTWEMTDIFSEEGLLIDFTHDYQIAEVEVTFGTGNIGSEGDDWIRGGFGNDAIDGLAGDDYLVGGLGYDAIAGGQGDDVLSGGAGNDRLYGNLGDDTLRGGDGNDTLFGGDGHDSYEGGAGADWFEMNYDTEGGEILDFELGVDAIDLSEVFATASSAEIVGPGYFDLAEDLGPGGDGSTWRLELSQEGSDTLLRVLDQAHAEQMTVTLKGIATTDITDDFFASFQLGRETAFTLGGAPAAAAGKATAAAALAPVDWGDRFRPFQEAADRRAAASDRFDPDDETIFDARDWGDGPRPPDAGAASGSDGGPARTELAEAPDTTDPESGAALHLDQLHLAV